MERQCLTCRTAGGKPVRISCLCMGTPVLSCRSCCQSLRVMPGDRPLSVTWELGPLHLITMWPLMALYYWSSQTRCSLESRSAACCPHKRWGGNCLLQACCESGEAGRWQPPTGQTTTPALSTFRSCCCMHVGSEVFSLVDNPPTAAFHRATSAPAQRCVYQPTQLEMSAI